MKKKLKPSLLLEDFGIYPRASLDDIAVNRYADAIRAGATFPAPTVDRDTLRIVDGWHRIRAHKKVSSDEPITVDVVAFADEAALVCFAVEANSHHGRSYGTQDAIRAVSILNEHGISRAEAAKILSITEAKIDRMIETRVARASNMRITTTRPKSARHDNGETTHAVTLKPALKHLAGHELTAEQEDVNGYLSGLSQVYLVRQLSMLADQKLLDYDDKSLLHDLAQLRVLLDELTLPSRELAS